MFVFALLNLNNPRFTAVQEVRGRQMTLKSPTPPKGLREHGEVSSLMNPRSLITNAPHQMDNLCTLLEKTEGDPSISLNHRELLRGILYYLKTQCRN